MNLCAVVINLTNAPHIPTTVLSTVGNHRGWGRAAAEFWPAISDRGQPSSLRSASPAVTDRQRKSRKPYKGNSRGY